MGVFDMHASLLRFDASSRRRAPSGDSSGPLSSPRERARARFMGDRTSISCTNLTQEAKPTTRSPARCPSSPAPAELGNFLLQLASASSRACLSSARPGRRSACCSPPQTCGPSGPSAGTRRVSTSRSQLHARARRRLPTLVALRSAAHVRAHKRTHRGAASGRVFCLCSGLAAACPGAASTACNCGAEELTPLRPDIIRLD